MNLNKPESYVKCKKLIFDWTDKQKYLLHYRLLKFYVKHGMKIAKVHEVISFKQKKWLEKYIDYNTQKRNKTNDDFEKDLYKLLNNAFYGKTMENVRNRIRVEFLKNNENEKILKWQSKLSFHGIHKSYEEYSSFTFKQTEVLMDKPIYLGFAVLDSSTLLMYETYYEKLQQYFGLENIQNHYTDCDSMILSIKTDNIINDLNNLEDLFALSNLNTNNELFSNKNKKVLGKFKIETPESIWIDEFIALRSKAYAFKCNNKSTNNLKGITRAQAKNIKFEEYYNCLFGKEYQKSCDNYLIRSINHDMYLQKVEKKSLSAFDEKR